jgi:hypothetical protein
MPDYSRVDEVAVVDNERLVAKEMFRATGVKWIRYQRPNDENRYATQEEWDIWVEQTRLGVPATRLS